MFSELVLNASILFTEVRIAPPPRTELVIIQDGRCKSTPFSELVKIWHPDSIQGIAGLEDTPVHGLEVSPVELHRCLAQPASEGKRITIN